MSTLIIISCLFSNEEKISIENSFPDGEPKTIISYEINSSGELIIKEKYYYYNNNQLKAKVEYPSESSGKWSQRKVNKDPKWKFYSEDGKKIDSVNFGVKYSYEQIDSIINVLQWESTKTSDSINDLTNLVLNNHGHTSGEINITMDEKIINSEPSALEKSLIKKMK